MKYLLGVGLVVAGIVIGYFIGVNTVEPAAEMTEPDKEYITEMVYDTVIQKEPVRLPIAEEEIDSSKFIDDSLLVNLDSLELTIPLDTLEDLSIRREKLISKTWMNVNVIADYEEKDSLIKEMMGIEDKMPTKILVEFWESPLNFSGYKLSRSKMILYGMDPHLGYKLYRNKGDYFLSAQTFYYSLKETAEFLPYLEVSKEEVFND